jgi:phosphoribosylformylglycinamidine cyclo-ligase
MEELSYKKVGVDITRASRALRKIVPLTNKTFSQHVISGPGPFAGLFSLDTKTYSQPVLVSSVDSVGTKIKVAQMIGKHFSIGKDIVFHCANDIACCGAQPLFFLDYIGIHKVQANIVEEIVKGLTEACCEIKCSLIGGEIAEMPDVYAEGDYDLVGCMVGIVERRKIITGKRIKPGDLIIGVPSSGLHTNGYSLAREVLFKRARYTPEKYIEELGCPLGEELLRVHRPYSVLLKEILSRFSLKGIAHITGGGIRDNLKRILPKETQCIIKKRSWQVPPIFTLIKKLGKIEEREMYRVFNMGIGLILVTAPTIGERVSKEVKGGIIGEVIKGEGEVKLV